MAVDITKVRFDQEIRVDNVLNLPEFFAAIPETRRAGYWSFGLDEYGFSEEWERPIAFVMGWLDDCNSVGGTYGKGIVRSWVDENTWDNFHLRWEREHFDQLAALVGWLAPESEMTAEEIARIPGPLDVPLFSEGGAA